MDFSARCSATNFFVEKIQMDIIESLNCKTKSELH